MVGFSPSPSAYTYDALNRLTNKRYSDPGTSTVYFNYDETAKNGVSISNPVGRLTSSSTNNTFVADIFSYDAMGRVVKSAPCTFVNCGRGSFPFIYGYDLAGDLTSIKYTSGRTVTYAYNAAMQAVSAVDTANSINYATGTCQPSSTSVCYAPTGALSSVLNGKTGSFGITASYTYNNRLEPSTAVISSSNGTPLNLSYGFTDSNGHNNGNVMSIANNNVTARTQTFTYDTLNRLASGHSAATSGANCWGLSYSYDRYGNMTSSVLPGYTGTGCSETAFAIAADAHNHLNAAPYSYDAAGNMTHDGANGYTYDAQSQMTTVAPLGGGTVTYYYNAQGQRVQKANGNSYVYGLQGEVLAEYDSAMHLVSEYVYLGGRRMARRDASSGLVYYYYADQLGTARVMTNASGTTQQESDYEPFGVERPPLTNLVDNKYKFTGLERDTESGLDHASFRQYGSSFGRWLTPDPLMASAEVWDPQTWNRYSYAHNNPLMFTDPTGMVEVTASQCAQDKNCVTVNVNVIYDKNANDGKGLSDEQKSAFEKGQLQNAKDQYGDADIHLNVTYTEGALSTDNGKTSVAGLQAGALNVVVTDQVATPESGMAGKTAVSLINANSTNKEDLPHEMAHQFMGDTQGWRGWIMTHDPIISGTALNAITDVGNDVERAWMRNLDRHSGPFSYYPLASAFHHNAALFQRLIRPTTKPQ